MDTFAPSQPHGPESQDSPPLTRRDLESLRIEVKACMSMVEACQRQVHEVKSGVLTLAEFVYKGAEAWLTLTLIYYGLSWIFSHLKLGWT